MPSVTKATSVTAALIAGALMLIDPSKPLYADDGRLHIMLVNSPSSTSGSGSLYYDGQRYRIDVGGIAGKALRPAKVALIGAASNLRDVSDIIGLYGAADTGSTIIEGVKSAQLKNANGVIIEVHGVNLKGRTLDLGGLTITARGWGAK